ncbi:L-rhamnose/proton symporter RhaT [Paracidobacterium acidisoli]|uniref:L-rhamnose/proton symporter RhaT n=1 Tax=Paracidobacterium acidisoli TaxID=2303751 RepID=A0A372IJW0_9BACT|nr:L-rhamnose/proton symporter RhaT [Paracidobacterium acidisoli]MBT9332579.1 L-rhamnose/proton symporter RhaT [Paracidobacterium acidisoli]
MGPNPFLGIVYHWIGGLSSASCYLPFRKIRRWSWEVYWLLQGVFSWIIAPTVLALIFVPASYAILHHAPASSIGYAYMWGFLWGIGGLTFGLSVRYLGIALGYAIALGLCTAFGTLLPPIFEGQFAAIAGSTSGRIILLGIGVCLLGIVLSGAAGLSKEREMPDEEKKKTIEEFSFVKGILVATFAGIMSACFAYGLAAGKPIAALSAQWLLAHHHADLFQNLPVLIIVLWGGFTSNFIWCAWLLFRNRTWGQYVEGRRHGATPWVNLLMSAAAGIMWYFQFFFYSMGQTKMGKYDFSSWTLHMASIIIFSTLWGILLHEWRGTSLKTRWLVTAGLALLVGSTLVVGYGNYLKANELPTATAQAILRQ